MVIDSDGQVKSLFFSHMASIDYLRTFPQILFLTVPIRQTEMKYFFIILWVSTLYRSPSASRLRSSAVI